jgi:hypothetical protein
MRNKAPNKHYDLRMIKDFLEHFRWEYVIIREEASHDGDMAPRRELFEQLHKYMKKYHTWGLAAATGLDEDGASDAETAEAKAYVHEMRRAQADDVLRALDCLEPWFEQALQLAAPKLRDKYVMNPMTVKGVLEWKARNLARRDGEPDQNSPDEP